MTELVEEFKGQISSYTCLGENTEKSIIFAIPVTYKKWEEMTRTISYRFQVIDSARFMFIIKSCS